MLLVTVLISLQKNKFHNIWIQTNIIDMDYEITNEDGQIQSLRVYLLNNELVPGMFVAKYKDIWGNIPKNRKIVL